MTNTANMTEGNAYKVFLGFFFPMLITNILQQAYSFADSVIVGNILGDNALGAVGNASILIFLITGFIQGITNGFGVIIAQRFGKGDENELRKSVACSIKLSFIITAVLTCVSLLTLKKALLIIKTPSPVFDDCFVYAAIIFGGLFAASAYNLFTCILRSLGDSKTPLTAIIISSLLNIALDLLLICVFKAGVGGAAAATVCAQGTSALICFIKLKKIFCIQLERTNFQMDSKLCTELIKNGLPMAVMNSITSVGCMLVQSYVNALGAVFTSAYAACNKYINLFMLPSVTAGFAVSSFTSQNHGAGKPERIRQGVKCGAYIGIVSYILLGSAMILFPQALASVMLTSSRTIEISSDFLRITGFGFFTLDLLFVFRSAVQGMGKPLAPMCSGLLEMALRLAVIILLIDRIGFRAAAYAEVTAWVGALAMNLIAYRMNIKKLC